MITSKVGEVVFGEYMFAVIAMSRVEHLFFHAPDKELRETWRKMQGTRKMPFDVFKGLVDSNVELRKLLKTAIKELKWAQQRAIMAMDTEDRLREKYIIGHRNVPVSSETRKRALELLSCGISYSFIAAEIACSRRTVARIATEGAQ